MPPGLRVIKAGSEASTSASMGAAATLAAKRPTRALVNFMLKAEAKSRLECQTLDVNE